MKIILASASPRRKELLEQIGIEFLCIPSQKEERMIEKEPDKVVEDLSKQKAFDILEQELKEDCLIIGADTVVVLDGQILGKPKGEEDAKKMLSFLQGKSHKVYTGVTLIIYKNGETKIKTFSEEAKVFMYSMTEKEILEYIESEEPMDKAGAYAIQGKGAVFIKRVEGEYNTVVGLPIGRIYQELKKEDILLSMRSRKNEG